ncbi:MULTISPECIES: NUDIX hydrolase [Olivibacter]|jgi:ADP-ribose pyrophosphatase YjhB (NUDIX family)|uniref:NUDIX hydrolase n=3 Tax=Sphingobacteriaceae TaxID=84566 RepID=F4CCR2_SPHS2|nr:MULTISPECIES: NUDIX domain-containing protein [Olivibacter]MDM8177666.1 NUDIX domain-containing protein [Olivibacter sp. 47]QEK99638.1 NUDIX hydrolase [Olivibacter sp. LS-1]
MTKYSKQTRLLVAVDCIIFGFDGESLKLLLIQRGFEPEKNKWSLMGGFVEPNETPEEAAARVLKQLTGLENVYMEQMEVFGEPNRDPIERTISIAYYALIDIRKYKDQLSKEYRAEWMPLKEIPKLIFDHNSMVEHAKKKLRYKAALHPILFELLPEKFTIPQILTLYEGVYDIVLDKRNFNRKLLSTGLLVRQKDKDKENSKKGAFYYKLNKETYKDKISSFLNFIPNP